MNNDLISRYALRKSVTDEFERLKDVLYKYGEYYSATNQNFKTVLDLIDNAPTVEERISYVQQAVNTIMHDSTGDSDVDKAFRNAARLIQNAIDGETPEFEHIEREPEKAKESEIIKAYTKGFDTGVETVKNEKPQGEWIDYSVNFYKCPECGYLLNKDCPCCQSRVILPKGGAE